MRDITRMSHRRPCHIPTSESGVFLLFLLGLITTEHYSELICGKCTEPPDSVNAPAATNVSINCNVGVVSD